MGQKAYSAEKIQTLFVKAAKRLQQGDAMGAKQGLVKVAKLAPQSPMVWYNLGLSHQHLSEHERAVKVYRKSIELKPDFVDAWVNLALSYKSLSQVDEAQAAAQQALTHQPTHPRALNLMGTLAAERGEYATAKEYVEAGLRSQPDFPEARLNLANVHVEMGANEEALAILQPLIDADPESKNYLELQAQILMNLRRFEAAAILVLKLQAQYPRDEGIRRLGLAYREVIRDHFGAINAAEELLKDFPRDAAVWNSLGTAYFQLDSIDKARTCYEKAIELDPDHAEYENNLGLAFSSLGDKDNAEQHYRRSIALNPDHAEAYRNIVTMKRFKSIDDPDAVTIKTLWERQDLDEFSRTKLAFALGKIYDDCGLYKEAFATYRVGNDIKFKDSRVDLEQYFQHMDRIPQTFDAPPKQVSANRREPKPIFILGMPRSGTTLVEQIIARHPQVYGCGELPCIERVITRMEKKADPMRVYPEDFWDIPADVIAAEAEEYQTWVGRLHDIDTPYITDKMPFNFNHVWLIRAMFPDAAIVHCRRHPLDVITSNYFQLYGSDISFVYNLDALTNYYVRYFRLMRHWNEVFPGRIVSIRYEDLIQDSDRRTRELIDGIGLPWDEACLDPKRSQTAVRTASIWQVRQGIYTRSRERWRNYEVELKPAIEILLKENILREDLGYV